MSCLAHNKKFRAAFHAVINELRNENRISPSTIRSMPSKCCTCKDDNKETLDPIVVTTEYDLVKLKYLVEQVNKEEQSNPKLLLSLNSLKHIIQTNEMPIQIASDDNQKTHNVSATNSTDESGSIVHEKRRRRFSSSSSDSDSSSSESDDRDRRPISRNRLVLKTELHQIKEKKHKPIKEGTFLFLPYTPSVVTKKKHADTLVEVAKNLQRRRFVGSGGHLPQLEKQYDVLINMITQKTNKEISEALEKAKQGLNKLKIHNTEESIKMSEKVDGEWVLIRSKKKGSKSKTSNIDQVLDDITDRWTRCLNIQKREKSEDDDSDDATASK